ncbi:YkgJ family cysteine cluster protein [Leptolyngbya sp. PCC 6406]|uniref:YkgJ family cysteine cluster protein n=1 Tax=Leptolyngbya sp. PCC 6406 TaxID=1173264 RepID=UPI0002AC278C|nr:YkgJ family cysteine cluster protein [Leptolyngbya sp. PCC 6406]
MSHWHCIQSCGACCHLDPSDRPDLDQYLSPEDLAHYLSLVGADGWCIHFDADQRRCGIYEDRPWFCRVQADTFNALYGITPADLDEFAIACCQTQIAEVYGEGSDEMERFEVAIEGTIADRIDGTVSGTIARVPKTLDNESNMK